MYEKNDAPKCGTPNQRTEIMVRTEEVLKAAYEARDVTLRIIKSLLGAKPQEKQKEPIAPREETICAILNEIQNCLNTIIS